MSLKASLQPNAVVHDTLKKTGSSLLEDYFISTSGVKN